MVKNDDGLANRLVRITFTMNLLCRGCCHDREMMTTVTVAQDDGSGNEHDHSYCFCHREFHCVTTAVIVCVASCL